jgi:hypothetical protein
MRRLVQAGAALPFKPLQQQLMRTTFVIKKPWGLWTLPLSLLRSVPGLTVKPAGSASLRHGRRFRLCLRH